MHSVITSRRMLIRTMSQEFYLIWFFFFIFRQMKNCKFIRWLPLSFFYYFDRIQDPVLLWHMGVLETIARRVGSDTSAAAAAIGTYTAHITEDMIKYPSSYFSPKKISKGLCNHWVRSCSYKYNEAKNFLKSYFYIIMRQFSQEFSCSIIYFTDIYNENYLGTSHDSI